MTEVPKYWFPAKRYGWGWGLPCTWQGWVVITTFGLLVVAGKVFFAAGHGSVAFVAYLLALGLGLVIVVWFKGEPLGWRWGKGTRP